MNPGFNLSEAQQMLALSYVADLLGPKKNPNGKGFIITPPADNTSNPLPDDNGSTYPYPTCPIWPTGWGPGIPSIDQDKPWFNSILQADPANLPKELMDLVLGANNVIVAYNSDLDAYAVAFAGTENLAGVDQDVLFVPVSAGPLDFTLYKSTANYIVNPTYYNQGNVTPPVIQPSMHFGFRIAVEEYTVNAVNDAIYNLIQAFKGLGKSSINLYVTGHSLGAAMAGVFSAWIQAGDFTNLTGIQVNLKTYTFAAPKFANDALANNIDNGISKNGMYYRVVNNLDTVPQIPPTYETIDDLNNPSMIKTLLPIKLPAALQLIMDKFKDLFGGTPPNLNYVHVGNPYVVQGSFPIMYPTNTPYPADLFPNGNTNNLQPTSLTQDWWQHWPYVYYNAMTNG